jgi:hypothetical protein
MDVYNCILDIQSGSFLHLGSYYSLFIEQDAGQWAVSLT